MNELHLFAGAGGGILAGKLLGHRCVCAVEIEPYAQAVLIARQRDKTFEPFPIWDDVQTFDGRPWRGIVDIVAGGFPCQDISIAGKGAGLDGERSGLWSHFARIIGEVRPRYAFIENSPMLVNRGLDRVLCDLAALGFDAQWCVLSASDCGAPHKRDRIWILAHANTGQRNAANETLRTRRNAIECCCNDVSNTDGAGLEIRESQCSNDGEKQPPALRTNRWPAEPGLGRVVDWMANRTHRLKAVGNGQVSRVAATAFNLLLGRT